MFRMCLIDSFTLKRDKQWKLSQQTGKFDENPSTYVRNFSAVAGSHLHTMEGPSNIYLPEIKLF